jgi:hypothetical protein
VPDPGKQQIRSNSIQSIIRRFQTELAKSFASSMKYKKDGLLQDIGFGK